MASVAAGYLPILLFLAVALGISFAFVILPIFVVVLTGVAIWLALIWLGAAWMQRALAQFALGGLRS